MEPFDLRIPLEILEREFEATHVQDLARSQLDPFPEIGGFAPPVDLDLDRPQPPFDDLEGQRPVVAVRLLGQDRAGRGVARLLIGLRELVAELQDLDHAEVPVYELARDRRERRVGQDGVALQDDRFHEDAVAPRHVEHAAHRGAGQRGKDRDRRLGLDDIRLLGDDVALNIARANPRDDTGDLRGRLGGRHDRQTDQQAEHQATYPTSGGSTFPCRFELPHPPHGTQPPLGSA